MTLPLLENSDHVVVSGSIDVPSKSIGGVLLHRVAYDCSRMIGMVFVII